jgi:hypothetical protein
MCAALHVCACCRLSAQPEPCCLLRVMCGAQVYCIHTEPNFSLPWQRKRQMNSTSSGFVAMFNGQRFLLTNAHSVEYYTQVGHRVVK